MSWSETLLFLLLMLLVPAGMAVYYLGESHGIKVRKSDQYNMLSGRTWLWVGGRFYPIDATEEQMAEVQAFDDSRRTVMRELGIEVDE